MRGCNANKIAEAAAIPVAYERHSPPSNAPTAFSSAAQVDVPWVRA